MSRLRSAANVAVNENTACYEKEPGCDARERKIGTVLSLSVV